MRRAANIHDGHRREVRRGYSRDLNCNADHLIKQVVGCASSAATLAPGMAAIATETIACALSCVKDNAAKIHARCVERAAELNIRTGRISVDDYENAMDRRGSLMKQLRWILGDTCPSWK